jgi:hypothetical protein
VIVFPVDDPLGVAADEFGSALKQFTQHAHS